MHADHDLNERCALGQDLLMRTRYLEAEAVLAEAEAIAWAQRDWDLLSRLYMPLQEARRQRRQRCGEGLICLDLIAGGPGESLDPQALLERFSHGQLLVAGWQTIEPGVRLRQMAAERGLYLEVLLAAAYSAGEDCAVALVPLKETPLPRSLADARASGLTVLHRGELSSGCRTGTWETYAEVMALWERLHRPFLALADAQADPIRRMEGYRTTTRVDYAAELAHQKLSNTAREMMRRSRG